MKIIPLVSVLIIMLSCNNVKTEIPISSEENTSSDVSKVVATEQNGDYSRLYAMSGACQLTIEEVARLFSLSEAQINTHLEKVSSCLYNVTYQDNSKGIFSIRVVKTPQKAVQKEIEDALNNAYQRKFIKPSTNGGHYIYKHPNQGYLLVSHPNYANKVKIQYKVMVGSTLTPTQTEYVENKAYEAANYLITKYND